MQPEADDVLAVNGINGVVIGIFNGQQPQAGQFVIELGQVVGPVVGRRNKNIVDRGFDDVAQAVHLEEVVLGCGPDPRGFEGKLRPGVEDAASQFVGGGAWAGGSAVVGEPSAGPWRQVEPAEKRLRPEQLVKRISPAGLIIQRHRSIGLGKTAAIITG